MDGNSKSKPRIIVVTGNGKGKTTSAMGLALRASGHGLRVKVLQFIKESPTGELTAFKHIPDVEIEQCGRGFVLKNSTVGKMRTHKDAAEAGWDSAKEALADDNCKVVVLDEIFSAISMNLLSRRQVLQAITATERDVCIVLTGRDAGEDFLELADTVSEIKCLKHGMNLGIEAQRGVEF